MYIKTNVTVVVGKLGSVFTICKYKREIFDDSRFCQSQRYVGNNVLLYTPPLTAQFKVVKQNRYTIFKFLIDKQSQFEYRLSDVPLLSQLNL